MKPLLFLDIDGVLNGDSARFSEHHTVVIDPATLPVSPFTISPADEAPIELDVDVDPRHRDYLASLAEHFELVWASTWEHLANVHIAPLFDLPELPFVELAAEPACRRRAGDLEDVADWKWRSLLRHAGPRPLAFVDDQAHRLASNHHLRPEPTLVLYTPYGLTKEHVDRLIDFAQSL